jgi:HK97 family phage prohead protease
MGEKIFKTLQFKAEESGEFKAVFSTFNVIDHDGDVTVPGAFTDGQTVKVSYWSHRWGDLPVGRGVIHQDEKEAWIDGAFFMDTEAGRETYRTVKNLGELQEWSYGFDVIEGEAGQFDGNDVYFLKKLDVIEVSPVMRGAGIDTRTIDIKGLKDALQGEGRKATLQACTICWWNSVRSAVRVKPRGKTRPISRMGMVSRGLTRRARWRCE